MSIPAASQPFQILISFLSEASSDNPNIVDYSCSNAHATEIVTWGLESENTDQSIGLNGVEDAGAVLGCEDGSLFVFHTARKLPPMENLNLTVPELSPLSTKSRRFSRSSLATSRSASPSALSLAPAFNLTPRTGVVSTVTKEQVEAPKNYVDFDDEPEKLKDILKGQVHKPRQSMEISRDLTSPSPPKSEPLSPTSKKPKEQPRSWKSANTSTAATPRSPLSTPTSPTLHPSLPQLSQKLELSFHVYMPRSENKSTVTALSMLADKYIVVLQESGDISVVSLTDGNCVATAQVDSEQLQPPGGTQSNIGLPGQWVWSSMSLFQMNDTKLLIVSAALDPTTAQPSMLDSMNSDSSMSSKVAVYEIISDSQILASSYGLEKVGEWSYSGPSRSIGMYWEPPDVTILWHLNSSGQVVLQRLRLLPRGWSQISSAGLPIPDSNMTNIGPLQLPNPFKGIRIHSTEEDTPSKETSPGNDSRLTLDPPHLIETLSLAGSSIGLRGYGTASGQLRGICWSEREFTVFQCTGSSLSNLCSMPMSGICSGKWLNDETFLLHLIDRTETYVLAAVDADGDDIQTKTTINSAQRVLPRLVNCIAVDFSVHARAAVSCSRSVFASSDEQGSLRIAMHEDGESLPSSILWGQAKSRKARDRISSILPVDVENMILGLADGRIHRRNFSQLFRSESSSSKSRTSDVPLNCAVCSLFTVQNFRTHEWLIVGGGDDGSVLVWSLSSLKLVARWTIFVTPLSRVSQFEERSGPLRGCILCVAQDGSIAVVSIDGFQFLYIIPASTATLSEICLGGGDSLLLLYRDGRARLWDLKTKEFWRSLTDDKAKELLAQGGWTITSRVSNVQSSKTILRSVADGSNCADLACTLCLDLERMVSDATATMKSISTSKQETRFIYASLDRLRYVLSAVLTFGLSDEIDLVCSEKLGIRRSNATLGFQNSLGSFIVYSKKRAQDEWSISGDVSASRSLALVSLLRSMALFEDLTEAVNIVIAFYTSSLPLVIGLSYQPPNLTFLARQWFDSSNEIRQAARILLDAVISRLADEDAIKITDQWQHHLPCLQPTAERESITAALALLLCGNLTSEKYTLFSVSALTDISKSIVLYLQDERSVYRVLAIDLCSRGFNVWQHYIDAMEILRSLFTLATTSKKESISSQNIGAQARLAVLHIASSDTPLFMTTLGLDIINPQTLDHRKSVMQIVAFLIRKRPLVLYPNLPRLMEAVVKSLDPNSSSHREAVLDSATEILGLVVKSFPIVDFHMSSQRLAVGTSEGAAIMYDLKTGTRLYVLEGHKRRISACSFSPDGRRLVTLSLEEGAVLVWKVGTSFSSFFNPGAPPRQGHGQSGRTPFKSFPFNVGDQAKMSISDTFEHIRFDWIADRSVKLRMRESLLTLST